MTAAAAAADIDDSIKLKHYHVSLDNTATTIFLVVIRCRIHASESSLESNNDAVDGARRPST